MQRIHWLILLSLILIAPASQSVEVIAHPSLEIKFLSAHKARNIFSMRIRSWPDGTPIKVYVLDEDSNLHKQFSKQKLGIFPYKLRRIWDRYIYSGTGQPPITVKNEDEMMKVISSTRGAIGYASKGGANVRIIKIR
jgi:ABC-type phosphate transport system substrate-binding protein